MTFGGPLFEHYADPDQWIAALRRKGYTAAYCPVGPEAPDDVVRAYETAAQQAGIVIAETGAWSNPLARDETERHAALAKCRDMLALADRIGARCCVNIAGSVGPIWHGPDPADLTEETFDLIVETVRGIIDAVQPTRTFYCLETMQWMYPDSADSYLRLLEAIDRPQFGVHFDPTNLVNCPDRYFHTGRLITGYVDQLGRHVRSCHAKDVTMSNDALVHLAETRPGLGNLDYRTLLTELARLDPQVPLMMEHLATEDEYDRAAAYIRSLPSGRFACAPRLHNYGGQLQPRGRPPPAGIPPAARNCLRNPAPGAIMTPRERVLLALDHRPADRAPVNYHAHQEVTDRLLARLGLRDHEELLQHFGVDLRRVWLDYSQPETGPDAGGYMTTMWGLRRHPDLPDGHPEKVIIPFHEGTTVDEVYAHPWPSADRLDYTGIRPQCERHYGAYLLYGAPWSPFFHEVGWLIGQENLFIWLHTRPDLITAIVDCMVSYEVEVTRRFLEECRGMLDLAFFGNDFGTQRGLVMSPRQWGEFFRGPSKRFFDVSHDAGCRVMLHSCGGIRDIIPWLIEDGVDALDPVQVRAAGMDLPGLVRDFGDRLTFHGGVDTQHTLPFGTTDDVRREVRSYLDLTKGRGGYILISSQDLIADIPDDNILAMYDEALA